MGPGRYFPARIVVLVLLCIVGCSAWAKSDRVITIMAYNAENLFDTNDNPGNVGDNTYLPIAQKNTQAHRDLCEREFAGSPFFKRECLQLDWSDVVLAAKLKNLAAVIDGFDGGTGADVLVLEEVENQAVLNLLANALKNSPAYVTRINTEQSPGRGINIALLSKLSQAGPVISHDVVFNEEDRDDCGDTRDILEVPLKLPDGSTLTVLGLHFPSGNNPVKCRLFAAQVLNEIAAGRPKGSMLVALGDTNINCSSEDQAVISEVLRDRWIVPDEVNKGCRPPGSNFFPNKGQWSFLDLIMASRSLMSSSQEGAPWFADFGSFRTVISAPEVQVETDSRGRVKPLRFDAEAKTGTSDHWPVAIDIIRRR
jgi:endonuclease/exonuclease/phosphatase family metal-dependent hydrolase